MTTKTLPPPPKPSRFAPGEGARLAAEFATLRARILVRLGGVPIEVDDILDEMRGPIASRIL